MPSHSITFKGAVHKIKKINKIKSEDKPREKRIRSTTFGSATGGSVRRQRKKLRKRIKRKLTPIQKMEKSLGRKLSSEEKKQLLDQL